MQHRSIHPVFITGVFIPLLLAACGTLEVGFESQSGKNAGQASTPAPAASLIAAATSSTQPDAPDLMDALESRAQTGLRVAFIKNGNVWLWSQTDGAIALTHHGEGEVTDVRLSDDGRQVAFLRQDTLWIIGSNGEGERQLVNQADLDALANNAQALRIYTFDWLPGQDRLAFNTRQRDGVGRTDDLQLVDAISGEHTTWLPAGEGGEFSYSPDGRQVAIISPGTIQVLDSENRRPIARLTYTPIQIAAYMQRLTSSAWPLAEPGYPPGSAYDQLRHYVQPVWAADSRSLWVAVPPVDPLAQPVQATTIWQLSLDGTSPQMRANLTAEPLAAIAFAPDMNQVAYLAPLPSTAATPAQVAVMALTSGQVVARYDHAFATYGWSRDSRQLALLTDPAISGISLITVGASAQSAAGRSSTPMSELRWLPDGRFLYLVPTARDWDLCLQRPGSPELLLADQIDFPVYDTSFP